MPEKIKVFIADDITATRENLSKLMEFHPEMLLVGQAACAEEAIARAREVQPDIILMDVNMPGMDGISATEIISSELPSSHIIIMSVQGEKEYLRRAMLAGAKDYLIKPFTGDELLQAVKQVYTNEQRRKKIVKLEPRPQENGKVITVFSTKGGIGKTTIATNLAIALAEKTRTRVGIIDADLQFGDVGLFLNLMPKATIADLVQDMDNLDEKLLEGYLAAYSSAVSVLPAPLRPEQADLVTGAHLSAILKVMRKTYQYIIIDTAPSFNDAMLSVLDAADQVFVVAAMDLPTIKNVRLCLEIMESLNYRREKIKLILNRANVESGMRVEEVSESLHYPFTATLPSDGRTVVASVNKGVPFVIGAPEAPISQQLFQLARIVANDDWKPQDEAKGVVTKLKRLFG
jgi:pilus assembly protein CpaE